MASRFLFVPAVLALAVCGAQAAPDSAAAPSGSDFQHEVEERTFALVNDYREKDDLPALKWNDGIAEIARAHSRDMASGEVDFGHEGFGDRVDQLKALIAGFRGAGENVFFTDNLDEVASRAVQMWLHSPHHLKNIRGDYNLSGIGVWQGSNGALYFTQIFLKIGAPGN